MHAIRHDEAKTLSFDKPTLIEVIHFTNATQLGEPPDIEQIQLSADGATFAVALIAFHEKTADVDWESFYRCGVFIAEDCYRVAVQPAIWDCLPIAEMEVPIKWLFLYGR